MRKPKIEPTHDYHLSSAFSDEDIMGLVLKGHLVIEAMLGKILTHAGYSDEIWRWSFSKKIDECKKTVLFLNW